MNKSKRKLIAAAIIVLVIVAVFDWLFVHDSGLNFYKKTRVKNFAESYITKSYPDFHLKDIDVHYDKALNYYIANCENDSGSVITLNYSTTLFMEFDCYYNEKYTAEAVRYQKETEEKFAKALSESGLDCDTVTVYVDLNASDKQDIVYNNAEIKNERIECVLTYVRKDGEAVLDKYQLADLARDSAKVIYKSIDQDAQISSLKIKYDYDETKIASVLWSRRMEEMSLAEIAEEIKY